MVSGETNLGWGNPISRADLKPGEVVLDLGSDAEFDALLVAGQVDTTMGRSVLTGPRQEIDIAHKDQSDGNIRSWNVGQGAEHTRCFQPTFAR